MDYLSFPIITQMDSQLPLHLTTVGYWDYQKRMKRPEGFLDYQWLQCVSGTGELFIGNERHTIKSGQGFFLLPHEAHMYQPVTEPWGLHWLSFNGSLSASLLHQAGITRSGVYATSESDILIAHIKQMCQITTTGHPFVGMECSKLVYAFLLDLMRSIRMNSPSTSHHYLRLAPVLQYTEANCHKPITIAEMACCIDVSVQRLCQLFQTTMKMRPMEYVNRERINKSKELIFRSPELRIQEIAAKVGFDNPSYFTSVFKKIEGISPEKFRILHGKRI